MKWVRLHKKGYGAFSCEIYQHPTDGRYWVKVYVYGKVIEITGDYETINRKLDEFGRMWNEMIDTLDFIHRTQNKT